MTSRWNQIDMSIVANETIIGDPFALNGLEDSKPTFQLETKSKITINDNCNDTLIINELMGYISNDCNIIAIICDSDITIFEDGGKQLITTVGAKEKIDQVAISSNGSYLIVGDREGKLYIFNNSKGELIYSNKIESSSANGMKTFSAIDVQTIEIHKNYEVHRIILSTSAGRVLIIPSINFEKFVIDSEMRTNILSNIIVINTEKNIIDLKYCFNDNLLIAYVDKLAIWSQNSSNNSINNATTTQKIYRIVQDFINIYDSNIIKIELIDNDTVILYCEDGRIHFLKLANLLQCHPTWPSVKYGKIKDFSLISTQNGINASSINMKQNLISFLICTNGANIADKFEIYFVPQMTCYVSVDLLSKLPTYLCRIKFEALNRNESSHDNILITGAYFLEKNEKEISLRCLNPVDADSRLTRLILTKRYDEAIEYAKLNQLDIDYVYKMKVKYLAGRIKEDFSLKSDFINTLLSIDDVEFIINIALNTLMPSFDLTLELLNTAANKINECVMPNVNTFIKEEGYDWHINRLKEMLSDQLHRLRTYEIIVSNMCKNSSIGYTLETWANFRQANIYSEILIKFICKKQLSLAAVVWQRHFFQIKDVLLSQCDNILEIFIENQISSVDLKKFISDILLPFAILHKPSFLLPLIKCVMEMACLLEMKESHNWPRNALNLISVFEETREQNLIECKNNILEKAAWLTLMPWPIIDDEIIEDYNNDVIKILAEVRKLKKELFQFCELFHKHNFTIGFKAFRTDNVRNIACQMLDKVMAIQLISPVIKNNVTPYLNLNNLNVDDTLVFYIDMLASKHANVNANILGATLWEKKVIEIIRYFKDIGSKCKAVLKMVDSARVPWSPELIQLVDEVLKMNHPLVFHIQRAALNAKKKAILASYGIEYIDFMKNATSYIMDIFNFIVKSDEKNSFIDAMQILQGLPFSKEEVLTIYWKNFANKKRIDDLRISFQLVFKSSDNKNIALAIKAAMSLLSLTEPEYKELQIIETAISIASYFVINLNTHYFKNEANWFIDKMKTLKLLRSLQLECGLSLSDKDIFHHKQKIEIFRKELYKSSKEQLISLSSLLGISFKEMNQMIAVQKLDENIIMKENIIFFEGDAKNSLDYSQNIIQNFPDFQPDVVETVIKLMQGSLLDADCDNLPRLINILTSFKLSEQVAGLSSYNEIFEPSMIEDGVLAFGEEFFINGRNVTCNYDRCIQNAYSIACNSINDEKDTNEDCYSILVENLKELDLNLAFAYNDEAYLSSHHNGEIPKQYLSNKSYFLPNVVSTIQSRILMPNPNAFLIFYDMLLLPDCEETNQCLLNIISKLRMKYKKVLFYGQILKCYKELVGGSLELDILNNASWGYRLAKKGISFQNCKGNNNLATLVELAKFIQISVKDLLDFIKDFCLVKKDSLIAVIKHLIEPYVVNSSLEAFNLTLEQRFIRVEEICRINKLSNLLEFLVDMLRNCESTDYERLQFILEQIQINCNVDENGERFFEKITYQIKLIEFLKQYVCRVDRLKEQANKFNLFTIETKCNELSLLIDNKKHLIEEQKRLSFHDLLNDQKWNLIGPELDINSIEQWNKLGYILNYSQDDLLITLIRNSVEELRATKETNLFNVINDSWIVDDKKDVLEELEKCLNKLTNMTNLSMTSYYIYERLRDIKDFKFSALRLCIKMLKKWDQFATKEEKTDKTCKDFNQVLRSYSVLFNKMNNEKILLKYGFKTTQILDLVSNNEALITKLFELDDLKSCGKRINSVCEEIFVNNLNFLHENYAKMANKLLSESSHFDEMTDVSMIESPTFHTVSSMSEISDIDLLRATIIMSFLPASKSTCIILNNVRNKTKSSVQKSRALISYCGLPHLHGLESELNFAESFKFILSESLFQSALEQHCIEIYPSIKKIDQLMAILRRERNMKFAILAAEVLIEESMVDVKGWGEVLRLIEPNVEGIIQLCRLIIALSQNGLLIKMPWAQSQIIDLLLNIGKRSLNGTSCGDSINFSTIQLGCRILQSVLLLPNVPQKSQIDKYISSFSKTFANLSEIFSFILMGTKISDGFKNRVKEWKDMGICVPLYDLLAGDISCD